MYEHPRHFGGGAHTLQWVREEKSNKSNTGRLALTLIRILHSEWTFLKYRSGKGQRSAAITMINPLIAVTVFELLVTFAAVAYSAVRKGDELGYGVLTLVESGLGVAATVIWAKQVSRAHNSDTGMKNILGCIAAIEASYIATEWLGWAYGHYRIRKGHASIWQRALSLSLLGSLYIILIFMMIVTRGERDTSLISCATNLALPHSIIAAVIVTASSLSVLVVSTLVARYARMHCARIWLQVIGAAAMVLMTNYGPAAVFGLHSLRTLLENGIGEGLTSRVCFYEVAGDGALVLIPSACSAMYKVARALTTLPEVGGDIKVSNSDPGAESDITKGSIPSCTKLQGQDPENNAREGV